MTINDDIAYEFAGVVPEPPRYPVGVCEAGAGLRFLAYVLEVLLQVVTLGIGWIVWASIVVGKGQTPAKQLLSLRVVDVSDNRPLGFVRMVVMRGIVAGLVAALLIPITLGVLAFMPLWTKRKQNIWDVVSTSVVVVDTTNAWNL